MTISLMSHRQLSDMATVTAHMSGSVRSHKCLLTRSAATWRWVLAMVGQRAPWPMPTWKDTRLQHSCRQRWLHGCYDEQVSFVDSVTIYGTNTPLCVWWMIKFILSLVFRVWSVSKPQRQIKSKFFRQLLECSILLGVRHCSEYHPSCSQFSCNYICCLINWHMYFLFALY